MIEIIFFILGFLIWLPIYNFYIIPRSVRAWRDWALSDDGNEVLVEVLSQENGVIDHIAGACGTLIKSMFEGGFGQVAKSLGNNPQVALQTGVAKELKNMKWYESALLMKVANQIPELQPLLGLVSAPQEAQESKTAVLPKPAQASN